MSYIKTVSLWPFWAMLIAIGEKEYETRSKPIRHRGLLGIHATQDHPKSTKEMIKFFLEHDNMRRALRDYIMPVFGGPTIETLFHHFPTGCVVGTVEVVDCIEITPKFIATLSEKERSFGDFRPGRFAWKLTNHKRLNPPPPAKGKQGLWNWCCELKYETGFRDCAGMPLPFCTDCRRNFEFRGEEL